MIVPIEKWKKIARKNYLEYIKEYDQVDCGEALFEYIRPDLGNKMKLAVRLVHACKWAEARRKEFGKT